jgi:cellulose synthase/poly-beta-1,6-N-acetylglucosamine synthase-like glycosyltransferase
MAIGNMIILVIQILLLAYLAIGSIYIFIFSLAGLKKKKLRSNNNSDQRKFAVLIPGYKEDNVILDVAKDALNQDYPHDKYDVIVIADSFKPETLQKLAELPIKVIEVVFENSTKSKALNKAMSQLPDNEYDFALILDADNLMEETFLTKLNNSFSDRFMAIQAHRVAKNVNTSFAVLDAVSEEINNRIFRRGHRVLGLSSAIIGSGMAFRYDFFKNLMKDVKAVGGFDKEIELKMLKERYKIEYLENALVYDEKVQKAQNFSKQRTRWLSAQFHYFRKFFLNSVGHLLTKGNIDYFDKAVQMLLPPRAMLIGLLPILTIIFLFINPFFELQIITKFWLICLGVAYFSILIAIPGSLYNSKTMKAVITLPKGILIMIFSMFKLKGANKKFIHTEHGTDNKTN